MQQDATTNMEASNRIVSVACAGFALLLLAGIIWATSASSVVVGLRHIAADRWGVVTLLDVYAGAMIVATWMWVCERRFSTWLMWVVALVFLGHLVSLVYLLLRTMRRTTLLEVFDPRHRTANEGR